MHKPSLTAIAQQAMVDRGFLIDFPKPVINEVAALSSSLPNGSIRDLRDKPFFSIDNDDSKDLDQLTYAEENGNTTKIYVAIADVNYLVKKGTAIDQYALHNTTSVYTPTKVFPMLPLKLSTDLTSLNENTDRCSIVVEVNVDSEGSFALSTIYPALVRNHAKLTYNSLSAFLELDTPLSHPIAKQPAFSEQIRLQDLIAQKIKKFRYRQGALSFGIIELKPVMMDGMVVGLEETVHNRANTLIENFMISANVSVTKYLVGQNIPTLRRVVRVPKRWDRIVDLAAELEYKLPSEPHSKALRDFLQLQRKRDPLHFPDLSLAIIKLIGKGEYVVGLPGVEQLGHFDLALQDYAHTTAPNRRFPDLVMQRLLHSAFTKAPLPYSENELSSIAQQCTKKEDDATKVDRRVRKSAAAMVLAPQVGHEFPAMVTGAGEKGTWVRLFNPPLEGKLVKGFQGLDVGNRITVKLINVDINNGFIDFARI